MNGDALRIAVWNNLPSGGGKRALYDHVRGLVERGHHVESWCPPTADRSYLPLASLVEEHVVPLDLEPTPMLRDTTKVRPLVRNLAAMDTHARDVAAEIGTRFDVVFAGSCQSFAVPRVGLHTRVPAVLYLQEPNRSLYEAFFRRSVEQRDITSLPWLDRKPVARAAALLADAELGSIAAYCTVLVNSRYSRETLLRTFGVAGTVCYLGIDTDAFTPVADGARDYVVGVGAFVPEKNIELIIDAIARVAAPRPSLVWIGNHAYADWYVDRLAAHAHAQGVEFVPRRAVDGGELVDTVARARAMVYSPRLEPFGYAPLEANACGIPVVAGAEGGVRESIADGVNGLLVEADADALGAALTRIWADPQLAATLGDSARRHVEAHWQLAHAIDRLEDQLRAAAGRAPQRVD